MNVTELIDAQPTDAIRALLAALDLHGPGEAEHAERVAVYSVATAENLGLSDEEILDVKRAAQLHDIGKLTIKPELLCKLGELTDEDIATLRAHSARSVDVLNEIPWLSNALPMIRHHHERYDGDGYPDCLLGDQIPIGAKIIAVAETFDHIAFGSYWSPPRGRDAAIHEVQAVSGRQFDPAVVKAFCAVEPLIQPLGI